MHDNLEVSAAAVFSMCGCCDKIYRVAIRFIAMLAR